MTQPLSNEPIPLAQRGHAHRRSIRFFVVCKVLIAILIIIAGVLLPYILKLYYMPYIGVSLVLGGIILLLQCSRTIKPYRPIQKYLNADKELTTDQKKEIHKAVSLSIAENQRDGRMSQVLMIISILVATITVLSSSEVVVASSFIPLALVFGIEFSFLLIVLFVQKEFLYWLDKE